ncbi:hypothetical protein CMUS01_06327 [Colletotrichum musicola]|uniref:Uncharacterized protein n=1 Tax=Colletotrichum musicola TaxID=2175873 RepID=A0A8H6KNI9_9PEZI|nr:hypothetical protein CMUS01_06327 [Colletotrichum musicola]
MVTLSKPVRIGWLDNLLNRELPEYPFSNESVTTGQTKGAHDPSKSTLNVIVPDKFKLIPETYYTDIAKRFFSHPPNMAKYQQMEKKVLKRIEEITHCNESEVATTLVLELILTITGLLNGMQDPDAEQHYHLQRRRGVKNDVITKDNLNEYQFAHVTEFKARERIDAGGMETAFNEALPVGSTTRMTTRGAKRRHRSPDSTTPSPTDSASRSGQRKKAQKTTNSRALGSRAIRGTFAASQFAAPAKNDDENTEQDPGMEDECEFPKHKIHVYKSWKQTTAYNVMILQPGTVVANYDTLILNHFLKWRSRRQRESSGREAAATSLRVVLAELAEKKIKGKGKARA